MLEYFTLFYQSAVSLFIEMSPYLLLGFAFAGLLNLFFSDQKIQHLLGKKSFGSVLKAVLIGIPMPLCSCGVIPAGISLHQKGASKGATLGFLSSTPQTGVDSILLTYSLIGLPFAIIRPIIAFITGIFAGTVSNQFDRTVSPINTNRSKSIKAENTSAFNRFFTYAFVDFLQDISKWLIIGILLAASITVFVPDDFFINYLNNPYLELLLMLALSIPMYICATGSVPIAASLLLKGLSPGAAFVLLMAGPATNAATITVIGKSLGKKSLMIFVITLISSALIFGAGINLFLPVEWFLAPLDQVAHSHGTGNSWFEKISAFLLFGLIIHAEIRRRIPTKKLTKMINSDYQIKVNDMNCNHCKKSIEGGLCDLEGIEFVDADPATKLVTIKGKTSKDQIKQKISSLGFTPEDL